jgi:hypothetical protein
MKPSAQPRQNSPAEAPPSGNIDSKRLGETLGILPFARRQLESREGLRGALALSMPLNLETSANGLSRAMIRTRP